MRTLLLLSAVSLLAVLPAPAAADVIIVDGSGGGDYLTIQEGVDAAACGDTVLVYPGTYADIHECGWYGTYANVCLTTGLTLVSSDGPEVTVIDCANLATVGIMSEGYMPLIVEGFTVMREGTTWGAGIAVPHSSEVRGNVCTGFDVGITTEEWWYTGRDREQSEARDGEIVIADNTLDGNRTGIYVGPWVGFDATISGNSVSGSEFIGVDVFGIGNARLTGNDISGNTKGVMIHNPSHVAGAQLIVDLQGNRVAHSIESNIHVVVGDVTPGFQCNVTIGGSLDGANDIHGAPVNLYAIAYDADLYLDATYNYWGSVACSTLVPLFDIHESVPDSAFIFEPFLDETHTITYDCQGVPVEHQSWGSIKALYR